MRYVKRSAYLAVVLAAAAAMGAAGVATADTAGSVSGQVWFDRDRDQVRDAGEPGRSGVGVVQLYRDGVLAAAFDTDQDGRYTATGLEPGAYRLTYTDADRYLPTTPASVDITVDGSATVDFGMKGASISGAPWLDQDFDGRHDAGEPPLEPFTTANPTFVTGPAFAWSETDDRGRFRIEDLPAGDGYVVTVIGPRELALTKEGRDSVVDWVTGESAPLLLTPGADVTGIDAGYAEVTGDTAITAGSIDHKRLHVGEQVTVELTLANKGPVPDYLNVAMTWPAGLELTDVRGGMVAVFGPGQLFGNSPAPVEPRESVTMTVVLTATAPITDGAIDATMTPGSYGDSDPRNDARHFPIRVVR